MITPNATPADRTEPGSARPPVPRRQRHGPPGRSLPVFTPRGQSAKMNRRGAAQGAPSLARRGAAERGRRKAPQARRPHFSPARDHPSRFSLGGFFSRPGTLPPGGVRKQSHGRLSLMATGCGERVGYTDIAMAGEGGGAPGGSLFCWLA